MNQVRVTVIMPSLNVRPYIDKCLMSVRQQTLRGIEILCVDAGSTDGTWEYLRDAAQADERVKLIKSEKKSYGYQVNLGMKHAQGEYVGIVETDDYIPSEMLERLYDIAAEQKLDYIKADFSMFVERHGMEITIDCIHPLADLGIEGQVIDPRSCPRLLGRDDYIWKGIYRKSFLVNQDVKFNETPGAAYQDNGFLHQTILRGRRVMYLPDSLYQYRRDNENSSDYNPQACAKMALEYEFIEKDRLAHPELYDPFLSCYYIKMFHMVLAQMNMAEHYEDVRIAVEKYRDWLQDAWMSGRLSPGRFSMEDLGLRAFLDNPSRYWEMVQWHESVRDRAYSDFLEDMEQRGDGYVVVSCGDRGRCIYMMLARNLDTTNIWACDNNTSIHGKRYGYHPILSVNQAVNGHPKATFIIDNEKYHWELEQQLLKSGVAPERIVTINLPIWSHLATSWMKRVTDS